MEKHLYNELWYKDGPSFKKSLFSVLKHVLNHWTWLFRILYIDYAPIFNYLLKNLQYNKLKIQCTNLK